MRTDANRNFAALLDDLFVPGIPVPETAPQPSIPFDYLSVADELHSGRISVSAEEAVSEYREVNALEAEFEALLQQAGEQPVAEPEAIEPLASIEAEEIAVELGLQNGKDAADFGRIRRAFAFDNHPDRVAPHKRQRAMVRMQVANMLIDDAKRRAASTPQG